MPSARICIDCARTIDASVAVRSRCPACLAGYKAEKAKQPENRSPESLARRAAHQAVVGTYRWKKTARLAKARDGGCRRCGTSRNLQVHHLTPLSSGGAPFDLDNLVTLCGSCHAQVEAAARRRRVA
jgi:5-methylcytosine-specific restriction endonuclease McrA